MLQHLEQLLEPEPSLLVLLLLDREAPHQDPAHLDVHNLLDLATLHEALLLELRGLVRSHVVLIRVKVLVLADSISCHCHLLQLGHDQLVDARWHQPVLGLPLQLLFDLICLVDSRLTL